MIVATSVCGRRCRAAVACSCLGEYRLSAGCSVGGFQDVEDHGQKRSLSTIINRERLEILSRQTRTLAQLKIIDKKETAGQTGVRVELILPYQTAH